MRRAGKVALTVRGQLNRIGNARRPQPQRIDVTAAPARDRRIVRHGRHFLGRIPDRARRGVVAADIFDRSAEADRVAGIGAREFPRIAAREPVLWQFLLPTVFQALLEQPALVADAVTVGRNGECRHAVHEAGREPSQPAIAECRIGFRQPQSVEIDSQIRQGAPRCINQAQIRERIEQHAADQEFDRQIVDAFLFLPFGLVARDEPGVDDAIAHRERGGLIPIVVAGCVGVLAQFVGKFAADRIAKLRRVRVVVGLCGRLLALQLRHVVNDLGHLRLPEAREVERRTPGMSKLRQVPW